MKELLMVGPAVVNNVKPPGVSEGRRNWAFMSSLMKDRSSASPWLSDFQAKSSNSYRIKGMLLASSSGSFVCF